MKRNVFSLLFLSFYMNSCKFILVSYDEVSDSITFNNNIYYPSKHSSYQHSYLTLLKEENKHSEEDLSETEFWTYVFISLCTIPL